MPEFKIGDLVSLRAAPEEDLYVIVATAGAENDRWKVKDKDNNVTDRYAVELQHEPDPPRLGSPTESE